jgi:hypothetical protein
LLWVLIAGPGRLSLDHLIFGRRKAVAARLDKPEAGGLSAGRA